MKEIVWVFGPSAAGKKYFIDQATAPKNNVLRERLSWSGKQVIACRKSVEWVGRQRIKDDPVVARKSQLISVVQRLATQADVVLIKGQDVDLVADRPNQLLRAEPTFCHKVMYLSIRIPELMQRLPSKPWWDGSDTTADTEGWVYYQLDLLKKLDPKFELIALDGSANGNYSFTEMPEQLRSRQTATVNW